MIKNPLDLFTRILNNPRVIKSLPKDLTENIDFIEKYYIILKDEIKPYITPKTYDTLKHREIIKIKTKSNTHINQISV